MFTSDSKVGRYKKRIELLDKAMTKGWDLEKQARKSFDDGAFLRKENELLSQEMTLTELLMTEDRLTCLKRIRIIRCCSIMQAKAIFGILEADPYPGAGAPLLKDLEEQDDKSETSITPEV